MLNGISSPFGTQMQTAAVLTAAVLIAGRKFCLAGACNLASKVERYVDEQKAAKLDQASHHYFTLAKTDALRDFAAVSGIVAAVGLAKCAKDSFSTKELEKEVEVGHFENYVIPTVKYGAGTIITGLGLRSLITYSKNKIVDSINKSPEIYFTAYSKCFQWHGQAEIMGFYKLPIQFVTKIGMNMLDIIMK